MFIQKYKLLILSLFLVLHSGALYSKEPDKKEKEQQNGPPPNHEEAQTEKVKKKILPLPRHIFLPKVTYSRVPTIEGEDTLNFSKHRFWFVAMMASWNVRSADITKIFNSHHQEFKERDIGVIGLFSQNTKLDVEKWREQNKPLFDNYFASRNFVDSLKNPKIPYVWLIGEKGEILLKLEMPTVQQIDASIEKSFTLTGF